MVSELPLPPAALLHVYEGSTLEVSYVLCHIPDLPTIFLKVMRKERSAKRLSFAILKSRFPEAALISEMGPSVPLTWGMATRVSLPSELWPLEDGAAQAGLRLLRQRWTLGARFGGWCPFLLGERSLPPALSSGPHSLLGWG